MSAVRPPSANCVAVRPVSVTRVPWVGDAGAFEPGARRISTPLKSWSAGSTQTSVALSVPTCETASWVMPCGGVRSSTLTTRVAEVRDDLLRVAGMTSRNRHTPPMVGR